MGFIALSFILIYCNQTTLSLMAGDKEPIMPITYQIELNRIFNVYSQVIYLQGEGKLELNHQCFINSELWIFQQPRSSSNASQGNLREACWELGCVCRLLDMHSVSFTCIKLSFSFVFLYQHCSLSVAFASFQTLFDIPYHFAVTVSLAMNCLVQLFVWWLLVASVLLHFLVCCSLYLSLMENCTVNLQHLCVSCSQGEVLSVVAADI